MAITVRVKDPLRKLSNADLTSVLIIMIGWERECISSKMRLCVLLRGQRKGIPILPPLLDRN